MWAPRPDWGYAVTDSQLLGKGQGSHLQPVAEAIAAWGKLSTLKE